MRERYTFFGPSLVSIVYSGRALDCQCSLTLPCRAFPTTGYVRPLTAWLRVRGGNNGLSNQDSYCLVRSVVRGKSRYVFQALFFLKASTTIYSIMFAPISMMMNLTDLRHSAIEPSLAQHVALAEHPRSVILSPKGVIMHQFSSRMSFASFAQKTCA